MIIEFDFNAWASLAQVAPEEFEQRRTDLIEYFLSNGRDQQRLRGLQCRINLERQRARTAMKSCLKISSLMWDTFIDLNDTLNTFAQGSNSRDVGNSPSRSPTQIIQFHQKAKIENRRLD